MAKPKYVLRGGMWVRVGPKPKPKLRPATPIVTEHQQGRIHPHGRVSSNYARGAAPEGGPGREQARGHERFINRKDLKVEDVQKRLRRYGFAVSLDGVWGPQTEKAWKSYTRSLDRQRDVQSGRGYATANRVLGAVSGALAAPQLAAADKTIGGVLGSVDASLRPLSNIAKFGASTQLGRTRAREDIFRQEQYINAAQQSAIARGVKPPSRETLTAQYMADARPGMLAHGGVTRNDYRLAQFHLARGRNQMTGQLGATGAGLAKLIGTHVAALATPPVGPTAELHRRKVKEAGFADIGIAKALGHQAVHDVQNPTDPLSILDFATLAYLPFGVGARAATAVRAVGAAEKGAKTGAALRALGTRAPANALTPKRWLPADTPAGVRRVHYLEGHEQPRLTPNPAYAAVQHRIDRWSEAHPQARVLGAAPRVGRLAPKTKRILEERAAGGLAEFSAATRRIKTDSPEDVALRSIVGYDPDNPEAALVHLDREIARHRRKASRPVVKPKVKTDAAGHKHAVQPNGTISPVQKRDLDEVIGKLEEARPHVAEASARLKRGVEEGVAASDETTRLLVEGGHMTGETGEAARHYRARLAAGAKYKTPADARADIAELRRQDREIVRQQKQTQREIKRAYKAKTAHEEMAAAQAKAADRAAGKAYSARTQLHHALDRAKARLDRAEENGLAARAPALREELAVANEDLARMNREGVVVKKGAKGKDDPYVKQHRKIAKLERENRRAGTAAARALTARQEVQKAEKALAAELDVAHEAPILQAEAGTAHEVALAHGQTQREAALTQLGKDLGRHAESRRVLEGKMRDVKESVGKIVGAEDITVGERAAFIGSSPRKEKMIQRIGGGVPLGKRRRIVHQQTGRTFEEGREVTSGKKLITERYMQAAKASVHDRLARTKLDKMSLPLEPGEELLKGHVIYNPEGVKVARRTREMPTAMMEGASPAELEAMIKDLHEYDQMIHKSAFPSEADVAAMSDEAKSGLKQIDERIAKGYAPAPSLPAEGLAGRLRDGLDATNNVTRMALIYLNPSYIPRNYTGNLGFLALHQGIFAGKNLMTASRTISRLTSPEASRIERETLAQMDLEIGAGSAKGMAEASQGRFSGAGERVAEFQNKWADRGPRRAAWLHEAEVRGYKTPEQLHKLLTDADLEPVLQQVSLDARRAMVDFGDLTKSERAVISRALFIYPWMKGATRYGKDLVLDRPVAAAVAGHVIDQRDKLEKRVFGGPIDPMLGHDIIPLGGTRKAFGTTVARTMNLQTLNPVGQALDVAGAAKAAVFGGGSKRDLLGAFAQPGISAAVEAGWHTGFQRPDESALKIGAAALFGTPQHPGVPAATAIKNLLSRDQAPVSGPASKQRDYIQEGVRGHGLVGGIVRGAEEVFGGSARPRLLNVPAAQARGATGDVVATARVKAETEQRKGREMNNELLGAARKYGLIGPDDEQPANVRKAIRLRTLRYVNYALRGADTQAERFKADNEQMLKRGWIDRALYDRGMAWLASGPTDRQIKRERRFIGEAYYGSKDLSGAKKQISDAAERAAQEGQ